MHSQHFSGPIAARVASPDAHPPLLALVPCAAMTDHVPATMSLGDSGDWMACTDRLRLRLLRAHDAVPLRTVMEPGLVEAVVAQRGRGLATEAAAAVLDWAEHNGVDFYSSVRPPNPASVRVLQKVGMRLVDSYVDEDGQRDIYRR